VGNACLALVLNAHLPFVRRPEYPRFLEERWYFEALSETYLPLLRLFRRLESEGLPYRLTLSLSPTLAAMLGDPLLSERYLAWLATQIELGERETRRTAGDPVFGPQARRYAAAYAQDRADFTELHGRNILGALDFLYKKGKIEIITSAATHAFLPLYRSLPEAISAQVETALVSHRELFGKHPSGFWLPHLGWYPGLDEILRSYNVHYSAVTTRGAFLGDPLPAAGSFAPVRTPAGLAVFIRDADATDAVWSPSHGYPADPAYRDFYRDIGYDLPLEQIGPYVQEGGGRIATGYKYWAVTGKTDQKLPYDRDKALARVAEHAADFVGGRLAQAKAAARHLDTPPLMLCPYDAELFGHWWHEGVDWLEAVIRKSSAEGLRLVSLEEYLRAEPPRQVSMPEFSSWGDGGYAELWLDGSNDWVYRHSYKAVERMTELAERFPDESGLRERILNQGARQVLLAMSSDWSILMRSGASSGFARRQVEECVADFSRIYEMLCANTVETEWLTRLEKRNNLFPGINYRMFRRKR
jgi:1,4-alpha-glucan branching enzyme